MSLYLLLLFFIHEELSLMAKPLTTCELYTLRTSENMIHSNDALINESAKIIHQISTSFKCEIDYNHTIKYSPSNTHWILSLKMCTNCDTFDIFHSKFSSYTTIHKHAFRHLLQTNANTTNLGDTDAEDDRSTKIMFLVIGCSIMGCIAFIALFVCCKAKQDTSSKQKNMTYVIGQPSSVKSRSAQSTINIASNIDSNIASDDFIPDEMDESDNDDIDANNDNEVKPHNNNKDHQNVALESDDVRNINNNNGLAAAKPPKKDYTNQVQYAMVKSWLEETVQLPQYYPMFILNGFESMQLIYTIADKQTLNHIGIDLRGHQTKIMADITRGKLDPVSHFNEIQNHWLRKEQMKERNKNKNKEEIMLAIEPQQKQKQFKLRKETEEKQIEIAIEKSKHKKAANEMIEIFEIRCATNDAKKCESVQRVIKIMKLFEDWNFEQNNYGILKYEAFSAQFTPYHVMNVINDYHHYRDKHNTLSNILYVLDSIAKGMSHPECNRDHEKAEEDHQRVIEDKKIKISTDDAVKLQILCAMHSDMMHYDVPHIDDENEHEVDVFEEEKVAIKFNVAPRNSNKIQNKLHNSKHKRECSKFFTHVVNNNKKRISVKQYGTPQYNEIEQFAYDDYDSDSDEDDAYNNKADDEEINDELPSYGFGRRWYYWKHYAQHKHYIAAKYRDLKSELLSNSIYCIQDILDWNSVANKAAVYIKCMRARSLRASGELEYFYWGHQKSSNCHIKLNHIIALLFYCNYDKLQTHFSESFRIISSDTNRWLSVKKRNEEYANWSRLLREAVELYGDRMRRHKDIKLYHGLNCELVFSSINCKFFAPTSMTTSRAVAESFSRGFGLILTLSMYDMNLRYFDCSWISNYPSEEEKLFIGGYAFIKLSSIILSRLGHNYKHYICAIGIIQNMFDARHNPEKKQLNKQTTRAVNILLKKASRRFDVKPSAINEDNDEYGSYQPMVAKHKKQDVLLNASIPAYVEQLFSFFCRNWDKTIRIDIEKFKQITGEYNIFRDLIIANDSAVVKIDVICKIFENINCIQIVNGFKFTKHSFSKLYELLSRNENNVFHNLNEIKIEISKNNPKYARNVEKNVEKRKDEFAKINWNLAYAASNNYADRHTHNEYVIFVKDVPVDTRR